MKLDAYMTMSKISDDEFAEKIGKHRTIVSRYRRGEVIPPLEVIAVIDDVTSHAVSFRDFLPSEEAA